MIKEKELTEKETHRTRTQRSEKHAAISPSFFKAKKTNKTVRGKGEPQFFARTYKARCAGTFGVEGKVSRLRKNVKNWALVLLVPQLQCLLRVMGLNESIEYLMLQCVCG